MINEKKKSGKKDACYHKVKSRYSVWPSAYASGALVKCRKKGAKNWGKGRKDEALHTAYFNLAAALFEGVSTGSNPEMTGDRVGRALAARKKELGGVGAPEYKKKQAQSFRIANRVGDRQAKIAAKQGASSKEQSDIAKSAKEKTIKQGKLAYGAEDNKLTARQILQTDRDRQAARNAIATGNPRTADRRKPGRPAPGSPEEAEAIQKRTENDPEAVLKGRKARRVADFNDSEARAQAASRGSYRRKRTVKSADLNPETGRIDLTLDKESRAKAFLRGTGEKIVDRTPGAVARTLGRTLASPFKIAAKQAFGAATGIANTRQSINKGRASMRARRRRIDFSTEYQKIGSIIAEKSAAWTRSEGKNPSGGLNAKGVASYRAQNPGSKLKTAVTTKPSKLKKGSKAANRRKSFCARMKGMRKRQKSSNNTGKDRLSLSLKKWNC